MSAFTRRSASTTLLPAASIKGRAREATSPCALLNASKILLKGSPNRGRTERASRVLGRNDPVSVLPTVHCFQLARATRHSRARFVCSQADGRRYQRLYRHGSNAGPPPRLL